MILTDQQLRDLIKNGNLITGFDEPSDWDSKDSLVQPSSIDLHVGAIFRPGVKPGRPGSVANPRREISLKTGETAIIETKESINLSDEFAAIGFPPARVSSRGLLMTNPGHIDPGYKGTLTFTVINMGREEFSLFPGLSIVTILVFQLSQSVGKDYEARREALETSAAQSSWTAVLLDEIVRISGRVKNLFKPISPQTESKSRATQDTVDRLAPDFVDVKKRATKQAVKIVTWTSIAATVCAGLTTYAVNAVENRLSKIEDLSSKIVQLQVTNAKLESELNDYAAQLDKEVGVERRLTTIEQQLARKGPPAAK